MERFVDIGQQTLDFLGQAGHINPATHWIEKINNRSPKMDRGKLFLFWPVQTQIP
jgi:hypothetical protein